MLAAEERQEHSDRDLQSSQS